MTMKILFAVQYTGEFHEAAAIAEWMTPIVDNNDMRITIRKRKEDEYIFLNFDYNGETWEEEGYLNYFFIAYKLPDGTYNFRFQEECPFCKVD